MSVAIIANNHVVSAPTPGGGVGAAARMFAGMELEECLEWITLYFLLGPSTRHAEEELFSECQHQPQSLDRIQALVEKNPSIVQARNEDGHLPLHIACRFAAPLSVVQYLVEQYPESAQIKAGEDAKLRPLHWACWGRASMDVIRYLVELEPEAVRAPSRRHLLPLHYACLQFFPLPPNLETVEFLLSKYPEAISTACGDGNLPLHYACSNGEMSKPLVEFLMKQYPQATQTKNHQGNYPLHCALDPAGTLSHNPAPIQVIDLFVRSFPKAMTFQNNAGYLPLHLACGTAIGSPDVQIIQRLVKSRPRAVLLRDGHGQLPLDRACFPGKPIAEVVECLVTGSVQEEEDSVSIEKDNDETDTNDDFTYDNDALPPLHFACRYGSRAEVVRRLLHLYPEGCAQLAGRDQLLPLHCTVAYSTHSDSSSCDIACNNDMWPVKVFDDNPVDEDNTMQVLKVLLEQHPAAIYGKSRHGDTALHFACRNNHESRQEKACPGKRMAELIEFLLEQDPSAAMTANAKGHYPLHEACLHDAPMQVLFLLFRNYPDPLFFEAAAAAMTSTTMTDANTFAR